MPRNDAHDKKRQGKVKKREDILDSSPISAGNCRFLTGSKQLCFDVLPEWSLASSRLTPDFAGLNG